MPRENIQGGEHDDDLVMQLVDQALTRPPGERESYLRDACSGDPELLREVWTYVEWEERMQGFLQEPLLQAPADEHPFQGNDLIEGRFRIEREIAQGGMGIVYQVWDEKLDRRIAIKWPKTGFGKRLPPEVRLAREIRHSNVCEIFEIHTARTAAGEIDFIAMEYLEGETLADRLARRSLPEAEARSIARQLSAGLSAAHAEGVIHGDLKSQNVILTREADGSMRAVITDFGMARERESPQATAQSGPRGGTPDYMAPELWNGERATPASDVYALGVVLQELANGRRPESGGKAIAPARWKPIVSKCRAPKPGDRPPAAKVAKSFEPWQWGRWLHIAAAAVPIAAVAIYVTYKVATRPHEVIRLAITPFTYDADLAPAAAGAFRGTLANLASLKGGTRARYSAVSLAGAPTHVLNAALTTEKDHLLLRAQLTETRTGANVKDWKMEYAPRELRYVPSALAGIVTGALHLPPLPVPTMKPAAQADYRAGSDLLRHDLTVDAAIAGFERAVAGDSDSALAFAGLADAQYEKYTITHEAPWLARATDNEMEAQRRNPDLPRVLFVSASLATGNSAYDQAIAGYLRALELDPQYADAWTRLGRVYELNGQPDRALPAHIQATRVDPAYYRTYVELGQFLIRKYRYSEALTPLRKAVELAPAEPYARYSLALDYLNLGQFRDAESHLRIALDVQPTIFVLETMGFVLMYERREREAIPLLQRALALDAGQYFAWRNLGDCYRRLRLPRESELAYRKGLAAAEIAKQRDPRRGWTRSYAAYLNARLGKRQSAESEVRQALTLSSDGTEVLWMAAVTYEALGEREATLSLLVSAPPGLLADLSRWPDLAGLQSDPRFNQLLVSKQVQ